MQRLVQLGFAAVLAAGGSIAASRLASPPDSLPDAGVDLFQQYLASPYPPADGFDFPVGDPNGAGAYTDAQGRRHSGWRVATRFGQSSGLGIHPGEDWSGRGGGDTALGQPVHAIAHGRVVEVGELPEPWGRVVVVEHHFYENHERRSVRSVYAHLSRIDVVSGEAVSRRQIIGAIGEAPGERSPAHLHLELRTDLTLATDHWPSANGDDLSVVRARYLAPSEFIRAHRSMFVPLSEPRLALVSQALYRMRLYEHGRFVGEYEVGFGQEAGPKQERGDLRTPMGLYHVIQRSKGPFQGPYAEYFGGHWVKLNYPNRHDADRGVDAGWLTAARGKSIAGAWGRRAPTDEKTRLGGGIGFHGWAAEWEADAGAHLSWGCIVLHNRDAPAVYEWLQEGTAVVIF